MKSFPIDFDGVLMLYRRDEARQYDFIICASHYDASSAIVASYVEAKTGARTDVGRQISVQQFKAMRE